MRWVLRLGLAVLPGILASSTGACARRDATDKGLDQLRAEIAKMQADRDRLDVRVEALEAAEQRRESEGRAAKAPLPVVKVGEGEERSPRGASEGEVPDTDTGDPRPVLQASGIRAPSGGRGRGARSEGASSPEAKRDYDAAFALVRAKQYDRALEAFTGFLVRYPDHPYIDQAMFWRGECFYGKGELARAVEQLEGLLARFPYGSKTPDALLKIGLCQQRLGSQEQAEKTFAELKARYPKSEAVRQLKRP